METMKIVLLPTLSFALLMTAAVFIGCISIVIYRLWLHPLAAFPGPKTWGASRLPWIRHISRGWMWHELEHLHDKFGSILRIAPTELSLSSPTAWEDIYTSRPLLPKEPSSQTPPLNGAHSLFTAAGDDHRRLRGALASGFSDKALREQAPLIEHHANELVARLRRELATSSNPFFDIQSSSAMQRWTPSPTSAMASPWMGWLAVTSTAGSHDFFSTAASVPCACVCAGSLRWIRY